MSQFIMTGDDKLRVLKYKRIWWENRWGVMVQKSYLSSSMRLQHHG